MAWFAGIAGKAEDLLNKVDKSAAVALQKSQSSTHSGNAKYLGGYEENYARTYSSVNDNLQLKNKNSNPRNQTITGGSPQRSKSDSAPKSSNSPRSLSSGSIKTRKQDDDEKLLEYLNSPLADNNTNKSGRRNSNLNMTKDEIPSYPKVPHTSSGVNSANIGGVDPKQEDLSEKRLIQVSSEGSSELCSNSSLGQPTEFGISQSTSELFEPNPTEVKNNKPPGIDIIGESDKKLDEENQVLRKELSTANQNLAVAHQRVKNLESELSRVQDRLDSWNSQVTSNESVIRELRARETDLMSALDAKDSQLAVLRVRLQEADEELGAKRKLCEKLRSENEKLINEHSSSNEFQNHALESLKRKLEDAEQALFAEREHHRTTLAESMARLGKMEEEKQTLMENMSLMQKKLMEEKTIAKDASAQLKSMKLNLEFAQKELLEYKQKAQRILQSKDKLIAALKETQISGASGIGDAGEQFSLSNSLVLEETQQERDMLRDELQKANSLIESLQQELQEIEQHTQRETDAIQEHLRTLQEQLTHESQAKIKMEEECAQQREELRFLHEDLLRTKNSLQARIKDREAEADKLRKQLMSKTLNTSNESELEARLHALTESLIQKQTVVEALNTEKNSLVLQLERMEQRLKEAESAAIATVQNHSTVVGMSSLSDNSDQRYRRSAMFGEHPFDSNVTRKVKKAYGVLDAISVRVGIFLRQYPIARLSVIVYMFILHLWVMIVLFTYEPEAHSNKKR